MKRIFLLVLALNALRSSAFAEDEFVAKLKRQVIKDLSEAAERVGPLLGNADDERHLSAQFSKLPWGLGRSPGTKISYDTIPIVFDSFKSKIEKAIEMAEGFGGHVYKSKNPDSAFFQFYSNSPPNLYLGENSESNTVDHEIDHLKVWGKHFEASLNSGLSNSEAVLATNLIFSTPQALFYLEAHATHYLVNNQHLDDVSPVLAMASYPWLVGIGKAFDMEKIFTALLNDLPTNKKYYYNKEDLIKSLSILKRQKKFIADDLLRHTIKYRQEIVKTNLALYTKDPIRMLTKKHTKIIENNYQGAPSNLKALSRLVFYERIPETIDDLFPSKMPSAESKVYGYLWSVYQESFAANRSCDNTFSTDPS